MLDIKNVSLRSEVDIISSWGNEDIVTVSVICTTYNHESYIEDAIIGFLMQETDFKFEIIIHDDASTDKTADIVRKYQSKYPNIIKPIYQEENQYSKGGFKPIPYAAGFSSGKYIALCEGDDFWISENKLQEQVFFLELNKNINLSTHSAHVLNSNSKVIEDGTFFSTRKSKIIKKDYIYSTKGQFSPTASMMIRRESIMKLPSFFFNAPVGDFFLEALSGDCGVYYLARNYSVYRLGIVGSWSENQLTGSNQYLNKSLSMLRSLDDLKHHMPVNKRVINIKIRTVNLNLANYYLKADNKSEAWKHWLLALNCAVTINFDDVKFLIKFLIKF